MDDKTLLEWAAKAAGIDEQTQQILESGIGGKRWNPLTNDGDALRLAVKLKLDVLIDASVTDVVTDVIGAGIYDVMESESHLGDPYAATRRAIVRAAAEIGKSKEPQQ